MLKVCYGQISNNQPIIIEKTYGKNYCNCTNNFCLAHSNTKNKYNIDCQNFVETYQNTNITKCKKIVLCNKHSDKKYTTNVIGIYALPLFCNSFKFYQRKNETNKTITVNYNLTTTEYKYINATKTKNNTKTISINPTQIKIHTETIEQTCGCYNTPKINLQTIKAGTNLHPSVCGINITNVNKLTKKLSNINLQKCLNQDNFNISNVENTKSKGLNNTELLVIISIIVSILATILVPFTFYKMLNKQ